MRRILSNLLATLVSLVIAVFGLELLTRLVVDDGMQFDLEMWNTPATSSRSRLIR